ncbi:hypothetical protein K435DRAFT_30227 [Dendrothele bispora CBS 962.96]|uniref:Uncharacterized protein n=1 Tax=Dendrothele bispora (strain CBS 962.96) TaxID=1314807 RepID=A0A4S8KTR6_DENBC|nr:hypothetical protein K435DRAFT_30227 [Dendrothele bispora CBS 962.96]
MYKTRRMDYQRDRNRSYLALIQRLKAPTCTEKDKEFSTLLNETCTLWEDAESDAVVPVSPVADGKNQLPTPVTSPSSSLEDDEEPERIQTETDNDSDSDSDSDADADPSEQFLEPIQVQHVVVYHRDTL